MKKTERRLIRDLMRPIFASSVPTYLLDLKFRFIDWNASFQELCAGPLGITEGMHVQNFVNSLKNGAASVERAMRIFSIGNAPIVDIEPLTLSSSTYGEIEFRKIATQIHDNHGGPLAWAVTLNICHSPRLENIFEAIRARIESELLWARYSAMIESLFLQSETFQGFLAKFGAQIQPAKKVLCLGASTGREIDELLRHHPGAVVTVCEFNFAMKEKIHKRRAGRSITLLSSPIGVLGSYKEPLFDYCQSFDGMNRCSDPLRALSEVHRVLVDGGRFSFMVFRPDFDAEKMLGLVRSELKTGSRRSTDRFSMNHLHDTLTRLEAIFPPTKTADWEEMLNRSGFQVEEVDDSMLAGQATYIRARKPHNKRGAIFQ